MRGGRGAAFSFVVWVYRASCARRRAQPTPCAVHLSCRGRV